MYIENFWGGRGSSKYYHGYIEGGWGYKGPKNVLRSMWLIPNNSKSYIFCPWQIVLKNFHISNDLIIGASTLYIPSEIVMIMEFLIIHKGNTFDSNLTYDLPMSICFYLYTC